MEQLQQDVIKIEQSLPTADGTASEFSQQAGQDMGEAMDYMANRKGLSTEGMQRSAAQNIQNTRDQEQQLNEFMQMQQQEQQMDPNGGEETPPNRVVEMTTQTLTKHQVLSLIPLRPKKPQRNTAKNS